MWSSFEGLCTHFIRWCSAVTCKDLRNTCAVQPALVYGRRTSRDLLQSETLGHPSGKTGSDRSARVAHSSRAPITIAPNCLPEVLGPVKFRFLKAGQDRVQQSRHMTPEVYSMAPVTFRVCHGSLRWAAVRFLPPAPKMHLDLGPYGFYWKLWHVLIKIKGAV